MFNKVILINNSLFCIVLNIAYFIIQDKQQDVTTTKIMLVAFFPFQKITGSKNGIASKTLKYLKVSLTIQNFQKKIETFKYKIY